MTPRRTVWSEGEAPNDDSRALDALLDANEKLLVRAIDDAQATGRTVLVMPRPLFELACVAVGAEVRAELNALGLDTIVAPVPLEVCAGLVLFAGLPNPLPLIDDLSAEMARRPRAVIVVSVVNVGGRHKVVASLASTYPMDGAA